MDRFKITAIHSAQLKHLRGMHASDECVGLEKAKNNGRHSSVPNKNEYVNVTLLLQSSFSTLLLKNNQVETVHRNKKKRFDFKQKAFIIS